MLLGAVPLDDYECGETRERFEPGDVVVLYTDGCTESRDRRGKMLGIDGLERAMDVPQAPRRWTTHLVRFAESFQTGRNEDDILVATISRLAGVAPTEPVSKRLTKAPAVSSEAVS
jgi:serine phosphatase RsbU (regulator of sigma subunit)